MTYLSSHSFFTWWILWPLFSCYWFRCLPHDLVSSSYGFTRGNNGYWRPVGYNIWRTELIHEFSTGSFDKYCRVSAHDTKCFRKPYLLFSQHHYASVASSDQKSRKMLLYLTALVFAMVGCSYAAVPLYRRFCQATGYGGTIQRREVRL